MECNLPPMKGFWGEQNEGEKLDNRRTADYMCDGRWCVVLCTE